MITAIYAALLSVMLIMLSVNVIKGRRKHKVALGDGQNDDLQRRIRAHSNFTEYTPFFLILLGALEYLGLSAYALHALALFFILARISHAYGLAFAERMEDGKLINSHFRIKGMAGTFFTISTSAALVVILVIVRSVY